MIDVETLARLKTMRLSGMAEYFENLAGTTGKNPTLTGPEMVKMAVDWRNASPARRAVAFGRLPQQIPLVLWARTVAKGD